MFFIAIPTTSQDSPPLYMLPDARTNRVYSSSTLALARDGRTLAAANALNNTISILGPGQDRVAAEIPVGHDPRTLAFTADGQRILVVNRADSSLSIVGLREEAVLNTIYLDGALPYAVVTDNNDTAYISFLGSDEVGIVDLNAGQIIERIPTPDAPAGLALWGNLLYVTHLWSGELSMIYLPQGEVVRTISLGHDISFSQGIEIDPTRNIAYLPQTRSNATDPHPTYDSLVFPVVNVVTLRALDLQRAQRIGLTTADRPLNMPFAATLDRNKRHLYVANAGSNDLSVIDLNTGLALKNIKVGSNPRGVLLNADNSLAFVHSVIDGTLTIIDTRDFRVLDVLPISNVTVPADILIGAQLFNDAGDPRLSADGWVSCANCHFDGLSDGLTWAGFPDGPRNTPLLYNLAETAPYNWSGSWDEVADVEVKIRWLQAGTGLLEDQAPNPPLGDPHGALSLDLDTLTTYLMALQGPPSPPTADPELAQRGAQVFARQGCETCHVGISGTDLQRHDVDTGGEFDTPSLRWLWLSAPYLHDGRAATLRDLFLLPGQHQIVSNISPQDLDALVAYLLTLPQ